MSTQGTIGLPVTLDPAEIIAAETEAALQAWAAYMRRHRGIADLGYPGENILSQVRSPSRGVPELPEAVARVERIVSALARRNYTKAELLRAHYVARQSPAAIKARIRGASVTTPMVTGWLNAARVFVEARLLAE